MDSKVFAIISIAVLGVTGILLCVAAAMPRHWRWPWLRYRANLRWYKASPKHLLYIIGANLPSQAVVIHGFNYLTGKIKMRHMRAVPGSEIVYEYNANQITPVAWCNTEAKESTKVL